MIGHSVDTDEGARARGQASAALKATKKGDTMVYIGDNKGPVLQESPQAVGVTSEKVRKMLNPRNAETRIEQGHAKGSLIIRDQTSPICLVNPVTNQILQIARSTGKESEVRLLDHSCFQKSLQELRDGCVQAAFASPLTDAEFKAMDLTSASKLLPSLTTKELEVRQQTARDIVRDAHGNFASSSDPAAISFASRPVNEAMALRQKLSYYKGLRHGVDRAIQRIEKVIREVDEPPPKKQKGKVKAKSVVDDLADLPNDPRGMFSERVKDLQSPGERAAFVDALHSSVMGLAEFYRVGFANMSVHGQRLLREIEMKTGELLDVMTVVQAQVKSYSKFELQPWTVSTLLPGTHVCECNQCQIATKDLLQNSLYTRMFNEIQRGSTDEIEEPEPPIPRCDGPYAELKIQFLEAVDRLVYHDTSFYNDRAAVGYWSDVLWNYKRANGYYSSMPDEWSDRVKTEVELDAGFPVRAAASGAQDLLKNAVVPTKSDDDGELDGVVGYAPLPEDMKLYSLVSQEVFGPTLQPEEVMGRILRKIAVSLIQESSMVKTEELVIETTQDIQQRFSDGGEPMMVVMGYGACKKIPVMAETSAAATEEDLIVFDIWDAATKEEREKEVAATHYQLYNCCGIEFRHRRDLLAHQSGDLDQHMNLHEEAHWFDWLSKNKLQTPDTDVLFESDYREYKKQWFTVTSVFPREEGYDGPRPTEYCAESINAWDRDDRAAVIGLSFDVGFSNRNTPVQAPGTDPRSTASIKAPFGETPLEYWDKLADDTERLDKVDEEWMMWWIQRLARDTKEAKENPWTPPEDWTEDEIQMHKDTEKLRKHQINISSAREESAFRRMTLYPNEQFTMEGEYLPRQEDGSESYTGLRFNGHWDLLDKTGQLFQPWEKVDEYLRGKIGDEKHEPTITYRFIESLAENRNKITKRGVSHVQGETKYLEVRLRILQNYLKWRKLPADNRLYKAAMREHFGSEYIVRRSKLEEREVLSDLKMYTDMQPLVLRRHEATQRLLLVSQQRGN